MSEQDIQQTARFAREFVTMNLVPWMEKYVIEWNETVSINESTPHKLPSSFTSIPRAEDYRHACFHQRVGFLELHLQPQCTPLHLLFPHVQAHTPHLSP
jgi:hypothetical protein